MNHIINRNDNNDNDNHNNNGNNNNGNGNKNIYNYFSSSCFQTPTLPSSMYVHSAIESKVVEG